MILKEQNSKKVYSDGKIIEQQLLEIAKSYPEDLAEDFISGNSQYLINNTFSSVRKNLLNWYPFKQNADILEVGAGAGALTGLLCDKANSVVSIEMSEARASIIRSRYPNRKNLTIISENILEWKEEKKFDYVVFVGVLEYAAVFSKSENPFVEFLKAVSSHLKIDGTLLFAIENRFGLKYWLGGSEDHLQKPFVGVEGYKEKKTAQTFSKETLRKFCSEAGLKQTRFYSVYPDYKFPEIICAEGYKPNAENLRKVHFTYSRNSLLYADERDLYRELVENNVSDFFANSFLIEASLSTLSDVYPVLAVGKGEVKKEYRVSTVIYNNGNVLKIPVHEVAKNHIKNIVSNTDALKERGLRLLDIREENCELKTSFYKGTSAQEYFVSLLEKNDFNAVCNFLSLYKNEVCHSSEISTDGNIAFELQDIDKSIDFGTVLKDGYIDLTFYNAFYENGSFIFYDQEWKFDNVPLSFILFYAVKSSYIRGNVHTGITLDSLYNFLGITKIQLEIFEKLESHIWQKILYRVGDFYGEDGYCNRYDEKLTLNNEIAQKNNEIDGLRHSLSWKITAPLRFFKRAIKKVYRMVVPYKLRRAVYIYRNYGFKGVVEKIKEKRINRKIEAYKPVVVQNVSYDHMTLPEFDTPPLVSIIIPVYNQFDYTYKCISSIVNTVTDIPYEIIIGDDMSTDNTKEIEKYFTNIRVNKNESDHGFLMNCNRAARLAKGKYILFLNNDTQVQKNWLSSLVKLIEGDEKIGMVGSKLVYPDGTLQEAGGIIWSDASGWNYGHGKNPELPEFNYVKEADYISGASIMIRASLWNEIGGFDERYKPAYFEDSDLAFEVRKHGYKVMYQPESVVVHFEGVSNGTDLSSGLKKYQVKNKDKFVAKWADELKNQSEPDCENAFVARDRSQNKKVILMVDHYVPTFDKDAGSRTLYQYLKLFLDKGYSVKLIGDNFYKSEPYTTIYEQMGIEVLVGVWYANNWKEWVKTNSQYIDYIWLNRPHIAIKYVDFLKKHTNAKIVYYNMDLHFVRLERQYEVTKDIKYLTESRVWKEREFYLMKKVDMNYTISSAEKALINTLDNSIQIKVMGIFSYPKFRVDISTDFSNRHDIMFVGGFNHDPNVDAVLWFVNEIYPDILKQEKCKLILVGSNPPEKIKALASESILVKGFVSDEELQNLYDSCRLVVVPLRFGAGVKGKVLEAMYNGCPLITTSVGAEGIPGIENIVAIEDEPKSFSNRTVELYRDIQALANCSKKGLAYVKENFSVESVWNRIKDEFVD